MAAFRYVAEQLSVDFGILAEVEKINEQQKRRFFNKVRSALWTFRGKRLAVLGLAFKGGTDDVRESPAFDIIRMLLAEGCTIVAFDPAATERAKPSCLRARRCSMRRSLMPRRRGPMRCSS